MSGRGANGCGGCCGGSGGMRSHGGRGRGYSGQSSYCQTGLCKELGYNVFDYGKKGSADLMRTSWEKICQYVGSEYGEDIAKELQNKTQVTVQEPTHTDTVQQRHQQQEAIVITA